MRLKVIIYPIKIIIIQNKLKQISTVVKIVMYTIIT